MSLLLVTCTICTMEMIREYPRDKGKRGGLLLGLARWVAGSLGVRACGPRDSDDPAPRAPQVRLVDLYFGSKPPLDVYSLSTSVLIEFSVAKSAAGAARGLRSACVILW